MRGSIVADVITAIAVLATLTFPRIGPWANRRTTFRIATWPDSDLALTSRSCYEVPLLSNLSVIASFRTSCKGQSQ